MKRWNSVILGAGFVGAVAFLAFTVGKGSSSTPSEDHLKAPSAASASAAPSAVASSDAPASSSELVAAEAAPVDAALGADGVPVATGPGAFLLSGERPPVLPATAPKQLTWGVALVTYKDAQNAAPDARSRDAALKLAQEIAELAKTDFKAAVGKADKGSLENAGMLPRGVVEPAPEYVLFSLKKGETGGPVETPTGFWVVKRID